MKIRESKFKTLRQGDFGFNISDGLAISSRAGFEIATECPREYRLIIADCIDSGWLKPVATIWDYELTRENLD